MYFQVKDKVRIRRGFLAAVLTDPGIMFPCQSGGVCHPLLGPANLVVMVSLVLARAGRFWLQDSRVAGGYGDETRASFGCQEWFH